MKILLITPTPPRSLKGNRITALRWSRLLKKAGYAVRIEQHYQGQPCDVLIALHARRSFDSIRNFRIQHPRTPLFVALTGTDLYHDLRVHEQARQSLKWADRLIALQPLALQELPETWRSKTRVIYQSAVPPSTPAAKPGKTFDVCVIGHLRPVKDPFRTALAVRGLPSSSRIRVRHVGSALTSAMVQHAEQEMRRNPRYHWLGELARWKTRRVLAGSHLMVLSSKMEGGANVISEAVVAEVPILSSRIPGSLGLLGADYPGYFEVGKTRELREQLYRAETDPLFLESLREWGRSLAFRFDPDYELETRRSVLEEIQQA